MRFSRIAWLALGIGIFVIVAGSLGSIYRTQASAQEGLESRLSVAQVTLPKLISEKEDLESQLRQAKLKLTEARTSLAEAGAKLPESVDSIEFDETLYKIANGVNLKITNLTTSRSGVKEVEDITFSTTSFKVVVKGKVDDILEFINTIATDAYFTNATIKVVNMNIPKKEAEKPSATIELVTYSYKGE